jgi:nucleolar MIF4G domain-containing protein 1
MNTDIRRSIFLALMGSQDYVDAFENLMKLKLTDAQNREIVRVILHCASNEQAYNPYYGFVALKLCTYKHDYRVTFQYAFWDFLRSLGEEDVGSGQPVDIHDVPLSKMVHMAKLYGWLIGQDGLSILILRSINFTALQKQTQTFMRVLFTSLLASCRKHPQMNEGEALVNVFSKSKQVEGLAHGLLFCLHHYVQNESKTLAMNILSKLK